MLYKQGKHPNIYKGNYWGLKEEREILYTKAVLGTNKINTLAAFEQIKKKMSLKKHLNICSFED